MLRVVLDEETGIYDARSDALYSFGDTVMEALVSGKGPLGPIGCFGLFYGILVRKISFNVSSNKAGNLCFRAAPLQKSRPRDIDKRCQSTCTFPSTSVLGG